MKPVTNGPAKAAPQPVLSKEGGLRKAQRTWTFSLQHWRQIDFFALSHVPPDWFIDLLSGLRDTEPHLEALVEGDTRLRQSFHFHRVTWSKAKVRISRRDLHWLPKDIQENEDEFPIHQLSLCKGHFRVIGFWLGESRVFYVVLIDPHHNIHTAAGFESATYCHESLGTHHQLVCAIEELGAQLSTEQKCLETGCGVGALLNEIRNAHSLKGQVYVRPDAIEAGLTLIRSGRATSFDDILDSGILHLMDRG